MHSLECAGHSPRMGVIPTLRALSAERDDQKKARIEAVRSWVNAEARAEAAEAARDALKAELSEAKARLWSIGHAAGVETKEDLMKAARAFLARHQKGPPQ